MGEPPVSVRIEGGRKMAELGKALRGADKTLRAELRRGIREASKPVVEAGKMAAAAGLPHKGGLNSYIAKSRFTVSAKTGERTAGVSIKVSRRKGGGEVDLRALDRGRLRHPVYGHRDRWVAQQITPQVVSGGMEKAAPLVHREVLKVMDDMLRRLK